MWKPIIGGVDASPEGAWAATAAWNISTAAGVGCRLVHAVRDVWLPPDAHWDDGLPNALRQELLAETRAQLIEALTGNVPDPCLELLEVHMGRSPAVLAEIAAERDAGLIVVGGKRHTGFGRWIAGRTAHRLVRSVDIPLLIAGDPDSFRRILAAVDLSEVARPTLEAAEEFAALFGGDVRVLHAVEPLPTRLERAGILDRDAYQAQIVRHLESEVWPLATLDRSEHVVRYAAAQPAIEIEAATWRADLVVVGSHGHGRKDHVLLGSVTEALLNDLPASLLVVPVRHRKVLRVEKRRSVKMGAPQ